MIGIYSIQNKITGQRYIGETIDIDDRWYRHIRALNNNEHSNKFLQSVWNAYSKDNFEFTVLEELHIPENITINKFKLKILLLCREHYYIKLYDSVDNGYNLRYSYLDTINLDAKHSPLGNVKLAKTIIKTFIYYCPDIMTEKFCFEQHIYLITPGSIKRKLSKQSE